MIARFVLLAMLAALSACAYRYTPPALPPVTTPAPAATGWRPAVAAAARAPVILVSIDGFRPDYLDRGITPNLSRLATGGATGPMRPAFPSKTFPNHWTLVTGLVPDRHGIVGNTMEDAARPGETFTKAIEDPFWWNAAEPIWVSAARAGIPAAAMYWPGASVAWGGVAAREWPHTVSGGTRPGDWQQYSQQMPDENRVRTVIDWMRRPAATRPGFVTLYFDGVDTAGHRGGPDAPATNTAIADVDRAIGALVTGLAELGQRANIVIVSDHGMAETSGTRVIALDRLIDPADARIVEAGPYASFVPAPGREAAVAAALLRPHPHLSCWRKADIPARLRYGRNPRVPPFLCLADAGWVTMRTAPAAPFIRGEHGYDNQLPDMRALFVAHGPAFAAGQRIAAFDNVAITPLLRTLLGLPADPRLDGDTRPFRRALRR